LLDPKPRGGSAEVPLLGNGNGDEVSQVAQFHVPFYGKGKGPTQRAQSYSIAVGVYWRASSTGSCQATV